MNREELKRYIADTYGALPEDTFGDCPSREVFFCPSSQRCFAVLEDISERQLSSPASPGKKKGRDKGPFKTFLTLMCDPEQADALLTDSGFYPAYLTKRKSWVSLEAALVPDEKIRMLLNASFAASSVKRKRPKYPEDFFMELFGEPMGDRDFADCLIDDLLHYDKKKNRLDKRLYRTIDGIFRKGRTLEETSWLMGVSRERVSQHRTKGLRIIRFNCINAGSPSSAPVYKKNMEMYRLSAGPDRPKQSPT